MNRSILLASRPEGPPTLENFEFIEIPTPEPDATEILLKTVVVSVDPYLRGRMNNVKSYIPPFEVGQPVQSGIIAKVIKSRHPDYKEGDYVSGMLDWKQLQVSDGTDVMQNSLIRVDPKIAPLTAYLGILGLTGLTAYLGLTEIGSPEAGETLVVSGAAGAVGSVVGQIGKILGLRVVGIAGSDEKTKLLTDYFGFDAAINYKTTSDMAAAISEHCPDGVDIYFENVGGPISDAVRTQINKFARIVVCGAISLYNKTEVPTGPRVEISLIRNSALMKGFVVSDYRDKFPGAVGQLAQWLGGGKLQYEETIYEGFDQVPQAFMDLFEGKNKGKMLVRIPEEA